MDAAHDPELNAAQEEFEDIQRCRPSHGMFARPKTADPAELKLAAMKPGPGDGGVKAVFEKQVADMVNSPSHYTTMPVECIDIIRQCLGDEGFRAFCHGNAIKYVWRARFKGSFAQDMAKAAWYSHMAAGDDPRLKPK